MRVPLTVRWRAYAIACGLACHYLSATSLPRINELTISSSALMISARHRSSYASTAWSTSLINFGVHSCTQRAREEVSTGIVGKNSYLSAWHADMPRSNELTSTWMRDRRRVKADRWAGRASSVGSDLMTAIVSWSSLSSPGSPRPDHQFGHVGHSELTFIIHDLSKGME